MKERLKGCEEFRECRPIPSVTEKGKTFQLDNKKNKREVACVKVDGCVFNSKDGVKCDYLFEVKSLKKTFFVELKGSDVIHAIKQVYTTIEQTKAHYKGWKCAARIIIGKSKVPLGVTNRKEYEALYALVNKDLLIRENLHKEII